MHFLSLKESSILLIFIEVPFTNESSFSCIGNYFKIRKVWRLSAVVFRIGIIVYWNFLVLTCSFQKKKRKEKKIGVKKKVTFLAFLVNMLFHQYMTVIQVQTIYEIPIFQQIPIEDLQSKLNSKFLKIIIVLLFHIFPFTRALP